jgi:Zn-dependent protease
MTSIFETFVFRLAPLLVAVVLHEISHGLVAYALGDDTAKKAGRLQLHTHFDFYGSFMIPLLLHMVGSSFLIGYAKPVPVDMRKFRHPKQDMGLVAIGGPLCNVLLALAGVFVLHTCEIYSRMLAGFLLNFVTVNLALFLFNMLPIPPLDGSKILAALLPPRRAEKIYAMDPYGFFILIGMELIFSQLSGIFGCRIGILPLVGSALHGLGTLLFSLWPQASFLF